MITDRRFTTKSALSFSLVLLMPWISASNANAQAAPSDSLLLTRDDGNLYRTNANGSVLVALTSNPAGTTDSQPAWSPDGQSIVFVRSVTHGGQPGLYVKHLASGSEERLAVAGDSRSADEAIRNPVWGPNGYIAYQAYEPESPYTYACLHLIRLPQRSDRTLCPPATGGDVAMRDPGDVVWSLDGQSLYVSFNDTSEYFWQTYEWVYRVDPETGTWTDLYNSSASSMDHQYSYGLLSPAGDRILFFDVLATFDRPYDFPELGGRYALFSADGTSIAFGNGSYSNGSKGLWRVDADGVSHRNQILATAADVKPLAWAPDQNRLLFGGIGASTEANVLNLQTGATVQLPSGHYDRNAWSRH